MEVLLLFALKSLMCLLKVNVFALRLINKNKHSQLIESLHRRAYGLEALPVKFCAFSVAITLLKPEKLLDHLLKDALILLLISFDLHL